MSDNKTDKSFSLGDVKPEEYIAGIIQDPSTYDETKFKAAQALLPYRLPRLQSIEAVNRNVDMTHEEWVDLLNEQQVENDDGSTYNDQG